MILSNEQNFSEDQAITASAASTNQIDRGAPGTALGAPAAVADDAGKGNPVELVCMVTETFATLTSLKVAVQMDNDSAFGSPTILHETEAIAAAELVAGYEFNIRFLPEKLTERYVRLYYTVAGANATAGKITAGVTAGRQTN